MHGPDRRTVHILAEKAVDQLRGSWEDFFDGMHPPTKSMVHHQGVWNSTTDRSCHQEILQQL